MASNPLSWSSPRCTTLWSSAAAASAAGCITHYTPQANMITNIRHPLRESVWGNTGRPGEGESFVFFDYCGKGTLTQLLVPTVDEERHAAERQRRPSAPSVSGLPRERTRVVGGTPFRGSRTSFPLSSSSHDYSLQDAF